MVQCANNIIHVVKKNFTILVQLQNVQSFLLYDAPCVVVVVHIMRNTIYIQSLIGHSYRNIYIIITLLYTIV